jgi:seryl-tRNA synthetase
MKDFLQKLIAKRTARISEIRSLIAASQDVNEVRSLTAEAEKLQEEVTEARTKLNEIESEEQRAAQAAAETRAIPANAQLVNGNVVGAGSCTGYGQQAFGQIHLVHIGRTHQNAVRHGFFRSDQVFVSAEVVVDDIGNLI